MFDCISSSFTQIEPIHYSFFPFSPLDYIPYYMVCNQEEKIERSRDGNHDKRKWLEEGLTLLAESGAGALSIEMLTSR